MTAALLSCGISSSVLFLVAAFLQLICCHETAAGFLVRTSRDPFSHPALY